MPFMRNDRDGNQNRESSRLRYMTRLLVSAVLVVSCSSEEPVESSEAPVERGGVTFADDSGAYGGYCSGHAREIVERLAKQHADSGDGTRLIIAQGGEALLFLIPVQQERENLISMFLMGEEAAWHKAVQGMYDSCIRFVYIVDPATGVEEAAGFELSKLTYVKG